MFIKAVFIIAENWKQPKCPLAIEWINKHPHNRIPISNLKGKKELVIPTTTWMTLKSARLTERSHSQEGTRCTVPSIRHSAHGNHITGCLGLEGGD